MAEGPTPPAGEPVFDRARPADLESLVAIDAPGQQWTLASFAAELETDSPTLYVLRLHGAVAGFVATRIAGSDLDIVNIAIAEAHRRRGLGRRLLERLFGHVASLGVTRAFLEVRESNQAARSFYNGLGFVETQRRRGFYSDPVEDAVLMSLKIEP